MKWRCNSLRLSARKNASLSAFFVCKRTCKHILLKDLVEVVGVAEADGLGDLGHRHLAGAKKIHCRVYSHTVYVIDGGLSDALLKHLGEVVGRDVDHCGKLLDIYLLSEVLVDIADNGTKTKHVVVYHSVKLVLRAAVISEKRGHHMINIRSDREIVAYLLLGILVI